jgi:hypothetical protein
VGRGFFALGCQANVTACGVTVASPFQAEVSSATTPLEIMTSAVSAPSLTESERRIPAEYLTAAVTLSQIEQA